MGHEDRERKFEQGLARHLRCDGTRARNEAGTHADTGNETGASVACPDAETLAAFHEGVLSSSEMDTAREHVDGCSRCQQVFLLLEATDEIPLQVEMENDLKMREPVMSAGGLYADDAAIQTPNLTIAGQPRQASKAPADISRRPGFKALRWAAPAGAIAAGFLIWIVAQVNKPSLNQPQTTAQSENVQVAQQEPRDERLAAPPPSPVPRAPESVAKGKQLNERRKDGSRTKQPAFETDPLSAPKSSFSDAIANRVGAVSNDASPGTNARQLSRESKDDASRTAAGDKPPEISSRQADVSVTAVAPAAAPVAPGDPPEQSAAPAGGAAKTAAKQNASAAQRTETHPNGDSLAVLTDQAVTNDRLELSPAVKKGAVENQKVILAPKGKVRWRLSAAGRIERSSDGGVTWLAQNSGVNVELLAGSAPSSTVCWVVGRGGTILKTTDGGGHWSKVTNPNAGDISGIDATDAMHAVVYDVTAVIPARIATNDGGVTWFRTNK